VYLLRKTFTVSAAHRLAPPYGGPCSQTHGHNYQITVHCRAEVLNEEGMVVDFARIKAVVMELDHAVLNDKIAQPTAENIARYLCDGIPSCYRVDVEETPGATASYLRDI
jgi:6-pyruvoyltetrahydropterin/6-carboxytetrahydropterin synthase